MAFMVLALRPPLAEQLQPPARLQLLAAVLRPLLRGGGHQHRGAAGHGHGDAAERGARRQPPAGWHAMAGLGVVMMLIFGHIFFFALPAAEAGRGGGRLARGRQARRQITLLAKINLGAGLAGHRGGDALAMSGRLHRAAAAPC